MSVSPTLSPEPLDEVIDFSLANMIPLGKNHDDIGYFLAFS